MQKLSKIIFFNFFLILFGLILVIFVNILYKPINQFDYKIKLEELNNDIFAIDQSSLKRIAYSSYEVLGVYLVQKQLSGTFMNINATYYDNSFFIGYEQLDKKEKKINDVYLIDLFLENFSNKIK